MGGGTDPLRPHTYVPIVQENGSPSGPTNAFFHLALTPIALLVPKAGVEGAVAKAQPSAGHRVTSPLHL